MTKAEPKASQCPICNRVVWETDVEDCVASHKQQEKVKADDVAQPDKK